MHDLRMAIVRRVPFLLAIPVLGASLLVALGPAGGASASSGPHGRVAAGLTTGWDKVTSIPAWGRLDTGGTVVGATPVLAGVSCTAPGECTAAGNYADAGVGPQPFIASERGGRWGDATTVRGTAAFDHGGGGDTELQSISCSKSGYCSATGFVTLASGDERAVVVNEVKGRWGRLTLVVPPASRFHDTYLTNVSCSAPGDCAAVGVVGNAVLNGPGGGPQQVFAVDEYAGSWGPGEVLPGSARLNRGTFAQVDALSCSAPGECVAGGNVSTQGGSQVPFLSIEHARRWTPAQIVPGYARVRPGSSGIVDSVSCAASGSCSAVGWFSTSATYTRAFAVEEVLGAWRPVTVLDDAGHSSAEGFADAASVACPTQRSCSAVGTSASSALDSTAFVATARAGSWGRSHALPRTNELGGANVAGAAAVSCASVKVCVAAGFVTGVTGSEQAFVDQETAGIWRPAQIAPHSERLNTGGVASFSATSCSPQGYCAAVGTYATRGNGRVAMVENFWS